MVIAMEEGGLVGIVDWASNLLPIITWLLQHLPTWLGSQVSAPWLDPSKSIIIVGQALTMTKAYQSLSPVLSVLFFYIFLLAILTLVPWLIRHSVNRFMADSQ